MRMTSTESKLIKRLGHLGINVENASLLNLGSTSSLTGEELSIFFKFKTWNTISKFRGLSEDFIDKYCDNLNWKELSKSQILSEKIILKYIDRIYLPYIAKYQVLSKEMQTRLHIIGVNSQRRVGVIKYIII